MMADVITTMKTAVLFLDVGKVVRSCASSCSHHARLVRNLLMIMASKNLNLRTEDQSYYSLNPFEKGCCPTSRLKR